MRTLADMTDDEKHDYMNMLAGCTRRIMPPDGEFAIMVFGPNKSCYWVASVRQLEMPQALRQLASDMEADMSKTN